MQRHDHPLRSPSLGLHTTLSSLHFGASGSGPKVYIQASLHAEELPGMLAAYHLRPLLEAAETLGQVQGEVVLVPMANPVGAKTGKALPTGNITDRFGDYTVSCVDVAVPMVIARASEFGKTGTEPVKDLRNDDIFFSALKKLWIEAGLKMGLKGKGGKPALLHAALCLETQHYPDSPNKPSFPTTELKPGAKYDTTTEFRFGTR